MRKLTIKFLKFNLYFFSALFVVMGVFNACMSKYIYSEGEIREHYKHKNFTPCFTTAAYNGKTIHYAQTGIDSLPTILFIHGGPGAWYGWMEYLDDDTLRKNYNLIAVDRLGYGKSEYGKVELSTEEQAGAIKKVLEHFPKSKKVILVGRSYGAPIAALIARDLGSQVEKLVLISPVVTPDKEKFYWFSGLGRSKLINWMLPKMFNVATEEKYGHANEMRRILPEWKKVTCPTVIVTGAKDWVADTSNFHLADTLLKNARAKKKYWLPDAGHFITFEKKEFVKNLLIESGAESETLKLTESKKPIDQR